MDGCAACTENVQHNILLALVVKSQSTPGGQVKIKDRKETIQEILKGINAIMNSGGGAVLLHLDHPYLLKDLDEQLDDKLQKLISDDSLFHQHFERHFIDKRHVAFRVIPTVSPLSTLNMNSKFIRDTGLADVTHTHMKRLVRCGPESDDVEPRKKPRVFNYGQEVDIEKGVFQECSTVQAKRVDKFSDIDDIFWKTKIAPYISAFSRISSGGSLYLGIKEETITSQRKEFKTGVFLCDGISLSCEEKDKFKAFIQDRFKRQLRWLQPLDTATSVAVPEIYFHPVMVRTSSDEPAAKPDYYVIEVVVRYSPGICFLYKGPDRLPRGNTQVRLLSHDEWLEFFLDSDKHLEMIPSLVSSKGNLQFYG